MSYGDDIITQINSSYGKRTSKSRGYGRRLKPHFFCGNSIEGRCNIMTGEGEGDHPKDLAALLKEHGEQAIQCCIDTWNQLCPQYPLTNVTEVTRRKRWLFFGSDVVALEQDGSCGQISKIAFGINKRLTAKALRKHRDSPLIIVNCWICWDCGAEQVRGWSSHIVVDVVRGCVAQFPDITPSTPHVHCCPLP
jgi:hypothetical protein